MKVFRIFFKKKNERATAKSCGSAEVSCANFKEAVSWAWEKAEERGWRVAMVAELPTATKPGASGEVLKHTWEEEVDDTDSGN